MSPHTLVSPHSPASHLSPKSPNLNPFSPLSPHLVENRLNQYEGDQEMNHILGIEPQRRQIVFYPRQRLLQLSQTYRNAAPPPAMSSLDTWFGPPVKPSNTQFLEDPAIASISPPTSANSRRGGFGEGFGFGGGIGGGRGLGRGGRNIGLRRQPDSLDGQGLPVENRTYGGGQMGRFSVRNPGIRPGTEEPKKDKRRDEEWRRPKRAVPRDNRRSTWQNREDEAAEPAWMDDAAGPSEVAAPSEADDPLIKFIPGEDMIAAHKRAMKARDTGGDWRGDTPSGAPLAPFFGADPAIASSSISTTSVKPKSFNAADYLTQTKIISEEEIPQPTGPTSVAFASRFQRFFGAAPELEQEAAPPPAEEPRDDRMARLMGLLSTKSGATPSPLEQTQRHIASPPANVRPPSFFDAPPQLPPSSHPNALLQQLYGGSRESPMNLPSPSHEQDHQRHQAQPPRPMQHFSTPPPPMPHLYGRDLPQHLPQGYQPFVRPQPGYPNLPPPGFVPPNSYYGPPQPSAPPPHSYGIPPTHAAAPVQQYPPQLGAAQQDMLATLFAGLGPRS